MAYVVVERWGEWEDAGESNYLAFADPADATRCAVLHEARVAARSDALDEPIICYVDEVEVVRP